MPMQRQLVSVVVPVLNEEDGVSLLKRKLLTLRDLLSDRFVVELIFVDDGSNDETTTRLKEQFGPTGIQFCVVEHGFNRGVGAAFRTGFQYCKGAFVCTIDADCSYSPEGLKLLLTALNVTGRDIAVASPYHPQGGVEGVPKWRLVLSKGCSALYRMFSPVKLYTYTSIFRAYRVEVVRNVQFDSNGFVSAPEILISAARQGYTVTEVPLVLKARSVGRSKMKILRTIASHLEMLVGFFGSSPKPGTLHVPPRPAKPLIKATLAPGDNKDPFAA